MLMGQLLDNQKEQMKFLSTWLNMWTPQNNQVVPESRDFLLESIENEAASGNQLAQELIADPDLLKDYLRTLKTQ
jgi:hypothetical protein